MRCFRLPAACKRGLVVALALVCLAGCKDNQSNSVQADGGVDQCQFCASEGVRLWAKAESVYDQLDVAYFDRADDAILEARAALLQDTTRRVCYASSVTGAQGGYVGAQARCDNECSSELRPSRVCTAQELIPFFATDARNSSGNDAWVFAGTGGAVGPDGIEITDCAGWTSAAPTQRGHTMFGSRTCDTGLPVACCQGIAP